MVRSPFSPLGGLDGATIEPLIPLLTFIGNIETKSKLRSEIHNEEVVDQFPDKIGKANSKNKKRGHHL